MKSPVHQSNCEVVHLTDYFFFLNRIWKTGSSFTAHVLLRRMKRPAPADPRKLDPTDDTDDSGKTNASRQSELDDPSKGFENSTVRPCREGRSHQLKTVVGKGNFGTVYTCDYSDRAESSPPEPPEFACISNMKEVHHENVLCIHQYFETTDCLFIITPYIEGGTLSEKVKKQGKFSEAEARRILFEIA